MSEWKSSDSSDQMPRLPFINDNDCGLGIAVRTYLDDLPLQANPTSPAARTEVKAKGKDWFQHSDSFSGNLDLAFKLWDAVSDSSHVVLFSKSMHVLTIWDTRSTKQRKVPERNSKKRSLGRKSIPG